MKHLLVLGIEFKFFQKPADVTVTIDGKFIDTFKLERDYTPANMLPDVERQWYDKLGKQEWLTRDSWKQLPSFFKMYDIDSSSLTGKLEIKVENDNSDYTNGFMRHSSMIKFQHVALFNKRLVENRGEEMMKMITKFDNALTKHYFRKLKSEPEFDSDKSHGADFVRSQWPAAGSFYVLRDNEQHEKSAVSYPPFWIGGSFTAEFGIIEKYHMKTFAPAKGKSQFGFPYHYGMQGLAVATYKPLLNMYNED